MNFFYFSLKPRCNFLKLWISWFIQLIKTIDKSKNIKKLRISYEANWFDTGINFFTFVVTNSMYVANKARQMKAINLANKVICIYLKSILY